MLQELQQSLNDIILGKKEVVRLAVSCMLAHGHLLLEDLPGMGKTTLSHALAQLTGMDYCRIQFTSDLLPADLIGISIFNNQSNTFTFHKGPLFNQLILADEINRAPPKTQSALLEAMEEKQISTDQGTSKLPSPFFVIATQNPSFHTGTYPLPESQLDRFLMCLALGYPDREAERKLLKKIEDGPLFLKEKPVMAPNDLLQLQQQCQQIKVSEVIFDYIQALLAASRQQNWFIHGLSPRAGKGLVRASQAYALTDGRDYVKPDDVIAVAGAVIDHRLQFCQDERKSPSQYLLQHVEVPL
ncbi:AAA family ATPase [Legionella sp. W05-934-2]|uniref:AAA family ATPase n=1 Tax=Legionella sp. W05-934-2 TaxID=1198649 RepID=UPI0034617EFF